MTRLHPDDVLFAGARHLPVIPAVDHYAGSEKLIRKALGLQAELGPVFDVTCDCEDGAPAGAESEHARMCAALVAGGENRHGRVGVRIHDITHEHWRQDLEILLDGAGARLAFITLPKAAGVTDVAAQIAVVRNLEANLRLQRKIPVHVLIETHGALREVWQIAQLDGVESLDLGLMDFVSAHLGAIPAAAMKSPGQFEHPLVARAKCEIAAAALGSGVVPSHNVTTELRNADVVAEDARRAREQFGFLRMWSIHPMQIEPILEAMRPNFAEVDHAAEILIAAQDQSWGPIQHEGRLHDRASYRYYWTLLARAHATGMAIAVEAQRRFFSPST